MVDVWRMGSRWVVDEWWMSGGGGLVVDGWRMGGGEVADYWWMSGGWVVDE